MRTDCDGVAFEFDCETGAEPPRQPLPLLRPLRLRLWSVDGGDYDDDGGGLVMLMKRTCKRLGIEAVDQDCCYYLSCCSCDDTRTKRTKLKMACSRCLGCLSPRYSMNRTRCLLDGRLEPLRLGPMAK